MHYEHEQNLIILEVNRIYDFIIFIILVSLITQV